MKNLEIHAIPARKDNYVYALTSGSECAVIDPGESEPVERFLTAHGLRLSLILCTHHHHDHIEGIPGLRRDQPLEVWTSEYDRPRIPSATRGLQAGQDLQVFGEPVEVLALPGHTLGQIGFWFPRLSAIFTGDTLFTCGCGRLFEGTAEEMFATMLKLRKLPAETQIYFGHEYTLRNIAFVEAQGFSPPELVKYRQECEAKICTTPTTVAREMAINPFLRADSVEEFRRWRTARDNW